VGSIVRSRKLVIMMRMMSDVSVILHSGVIAIIICCVSHNLSSAVRKLDGVLSLSGVVSLTLGVMMDVSRVGVRHVVGELVICWHIVLIRSGL